MFTISIGNKCEKKEKERKKLLRTVLLTFDMHKKAEHVSILFKNICPTKYTQFHQFYFCQVFIHYCVLFSFST